MGRAPCCSKVGLHRGPWTPREDTLLTKYIQTHGEGHWRSLPKKAGLLRCGKSCRLRWMNYLRPDIKRGNITPDEDDLIIRMHSLLGNRWSLIAGRLPGRTDNEIKNYWNTHLSKKLRSQGTDPNTHKKLPDDHNDDPPNDKQDPNYNKKRKNGTSKKKKKSKGKLVEPVKPRVHLPKPVRLSLPRNDSFECNTFNSAVSSSQGGGEVPWSSSSTNLIRDNIVDSDHNNDDNNNYKDIRNNAEVINGVSFLVGDDQDLVNGQDALGRNSISVPTGINNLEKLYEEYWQLLKTDDDQGQMLDIFAESLLI